MGYFKNAAIALDDLREFGTCRARVEVSRQIVHIHYRIPYEDGLKTGTFAFHCRDEDEFRRRVIAAARSIRKGERPTNFEAAADILWEGVKPHSLVILTNPEAWELVAHTT